MESEPRPGRGEAEAPFGAGGGSGSFRNGQQENSPIVPSQPEHQRYSELLKGYFEKFTRWKEILNAEEYKMREEGRRRFDVCSSPTGSYIAPAMLDDPRDRILEVGSRTELNVPEHGLFSERFIIRPGQAGKHLLVDPEDGKPLVEVEIYVSSQKHPRAPAPSKRIEIKTERYKDKPGGHLNYRRASYDLRGDTLHVSHKYHFDHEFMNDDMATNLINTIDALIPGSSSPTPQTQLPPAGEQ
jgi:hypothetical protein